MYYKILKEKGSYQNVFIRNVGTNAELNIGRVTTEILNKLEEAGIKDVNPEEGWNFVISETIARNIQGLAMRMKKPIREQSKKIKDNKSIDAMDVLLGLAQYMN